MQMFARQCSWPWTSNFFMAALVIALCGVAIGCGETSSKRDISTATLKGTVKLEGNDDHSGILVKVGSSATKTDKSGSFQLDGIESGSRLVEASKDGWKSRSKIVEVSPPDTTINLTLSAPENQAPVISALSADTTRLSPKAETTAKVVASDPDGDELSYAWSVDGEFTLKESSKPTLQTVVAPEEFGASGQLQVTVKDDRGASTSSSLRLTTGQNHSPQILSLSAPTTTLPANGSTTIVAKVDDVDGDTLSYNWSADGDFEVTKKKDGSQATVTAPSKVGSQGTVGLTVSDGQGGKAEAELAFQTTDNHNPRIVSVSANPPQVGPEGVIKLAVTANDPNDDELTFSWTAPATWKLNASNSATPELEAPDKYGKRATVEIQVDDGNGGTATGQLTISTIDSAQAPVISSLTATPKSVPKGGSTDLTVSATDPTGGTLSYDWEAPSAWNLAPQGNKAKVTAPNTPGKQATITATVKASNGKTA
ncbi:MAG: Ig-like domain-containing protein, partial [Bradymonadaceae bacterium]